MNIASVVTVRSMKQNRIRTLVTVIGVILSAAMFTAVTSLVSSAFNFGRNSVIYNKGNYHLSAQCVGADTVTELQKDEKTEAVYLAEVLGYAPADTDNDRKPYFYVLSAGQDFFENMPVRMISGNLPKNADEIILPQHYFDFGGKKVKAGDKITLSVGKRISDGFLLGQNNPYMDGEDGSVEKLEKTAPRTFTVTGIYSRPDFEDYTAPGYTAITGENTAAGEKTYDIYINMKNPAKDMEYFNEKLSDYGLMSNSSLLLLSGNTLNSELHRVIYGLAAVFVLIIFIGSVSLVYSAFSISVGERTKQFGLLSSVGSTPKQIRKSVFTEACIIAAIGIPIGIVCGIAGIGITLHFCGGAIAEWSGVPFPLTLSVSVTAVVAAAVIAFATVIVSAWIPSARASRITAVEAIRQNADFKIRGKKKDKRYSRLYMKTFGCEGLLAGKYFSRNRAKYRNTIISLAISVILFVSAGRFADTLVAEAGIQAGVPDYDIRAVCTNSVSGEDELEKKLSASNYCKDFRIIVLDSIAVKLDENQVSDEYKEYRASFLGDGNRYQYPFVDRNCYTVYINDAYFASLVGDKEKFPDYYDSEKNVCAVLSGLEQEIYDESGKKSQKFEFAVLSDTCSEIYVTAEAVFDGVPSNHYCYGIYDDGENADSGHYSYYFVEAEQSPEHDRYGRPITDVKIPAEFEKYTVQARVKDPLLSGGSVDSVMLIRPLSVLPESTYSFMLYLNSDEYENAEKELTDICSSMKINADIYNDAKNRENTRSMIKIIKVFSYGFIILISMISAANVFNTISTNISTRRRDYAMLRSVGMGTASLDKMMNYECLRYGLAALFVGIPISAAASFGINALTNTDFSFPWKYMLIASVSVFAVVFVSMLYSKRKIKKGDILESLRNENI